MDPDQDFNFALELQLKDLAFLEENVQHDTRGESAASRSDRRYAMICMKEELLRLKSSRSVDKRLSRIQRSVEDKKEVPKTPRRGFSRLSPRGSSRLSPSPDPAPLDKKCMSCLEEYENLIFTAPCSHGFCHGCTKTLVLSAINEESLWPPHCCNVKNTVSRTVIRSVLNAEELKEYNAKTLEYSTQNRLYCAKPTCNTFIPPHSIKEEHGTCPKCGRLTHALCRSLAHPRVDCPKDTALHEVLKVASKKKWKRCSHCRQMVERVVGCNHITCHCGHHFCYVCGDAWRACSCPHWYGDELILQANQEINLDDQDAPVDNERNNWVRVRDYQEEVENASVDSEETETANNSEIAEGEEDEILELEEEETDSEEDNEMDESNDEDDEDGEEMELELELEDEEMDLELEELELVFLGSNPL